jgi:hypothetical protein
MPTPYDNMAPPTSGGEFPDKLTFEQPGQTLTGTVTDVRWKEEDANGGACPILQVKTDEGAEWSVFCGATALYREVYAKRPQIGQQVRIIFQGYSGKAKLFQVDVAGEAAPVVPAPAAAAEQPFPQSAPLPTPQAQPATAAPWGAPPPATNGAPPAAPWGQ